MTASTALTIQQLNLAYFGRPADPASQVAFPASGMTDEEIVLAFVKTSEYTTGTITPNSVADAAGGRGHTRGRCGGVVALRPAAPAPRARQKEDSWMREGGGTGGGGRGASGHLWLASSMSVIMPVRAPQW